MSEDPAPGACLAERELWGTGQAFLVIASIMEDYEARYDLTEELLEGWLQADCFRNARRYPQVPDFFTRNRSMVEDMSRNFDAEVVAQLNRLFDRAWLPPARRRAFREGFDEGFQSNAREFSRVLDAQRAVIAAAQELHALLVANEAMITANFTTQEVSIRDERVEERVWGLVDEIQMAYETAATLQEENMGGVRRMLEEERSRVRP